MTKTKAMSFTQFEKLLSKTRMKPQATSIAYQVIVQEESVVDLAERYGISRQRIWTIVKIAQQHLKKALRI